MQLMKKVFILLPLIFMVFSCDEKSKVAKAVEEIPLEIQVERFDKLFFENFAQDERGRLLVSDILSVVKHLGLQSVAEGVETQPEVDFLRAHGCCRIQGFYYYRPMEAAAVNELLLAQRFHLQGKDAAQKNISDGQLA